MDPNFGKTLQGILAELKPEAAYFGLEDGKRTSYVVLNVNDPSELPKIAEPFFLYTGASLEITPVMTPQDLMKAGPDIAKAVQTYGRR
jgi:hypothetical protein